MVACKVILAVAVVFVAVVQIQGRPGSDTEWAAPLLDQIKSLSGNFSKVTGLDKTPEFTNTATANLNAFAESLKNEVANLTKTFEGKTNMSDIAKDWQTAVDRFVKDMPRDMTFKDFPVKTEQALKTMAEHGIEITKKAQGNDEIQNQIKEFVKKHIGTLMDKTKSFEAQITEPKKA